MARINWTAKDVSRELGDVQRAYLFEVKIQTINLNNGLGRLLLQNAGEVLKASNLLDMNQDGSITIRDLKFMARSVTVPTITNQPIESSVLGVKIKHPGMTDFGGTFDIEFEEYENAKLSGIIIPWMNLMTNFTPSNGDTLANLTDETAPRFGLADRNYETHRDVKVNIEIRPFRYNGEETGVVYYVNNAYPSTYTPGQYGTESANSIRPNVSFAFDWMTAKLTDGTATGLNV